MPEAAGELVNLLQMSISPIALISGVGLLLLSVTNRLGRVIDRSRALAAELRADPASPAADRQRAQLHVLIRRAGLLWASIAAVTVTILSSCLMVLMLTSIVFFRWSLSEGVVAVFFVALLSLLLSALLFFADVLLALRALRMEVGHLAES
jgi:hypothetical protein